MSSPVLTMVTFQIENKMYGMNRLAERLNELVRSGRIHDWHPGQWVNWDHDAIEIGFDSAADANLADTARRDWIAS